MWCLWISFTLWSQNEIIFHKSSTANTQIFWKPVTAFHFLHLHFYFSQSWNTFSCYYLSLKVLPPKISKLGLLSNFHRTYRKKASKYQAEILHPGFRAFLLSLWLIQQPLNTTDKQIINKVQGLLMVSLVYLTVSLCLLT